MMPLPEKDRKAAILALEPARLNCTTMMMPLPEKGSKSEFKKAVLSVVVTTRCPWGHNLVVYAPASLPTLNSCGYCGSVWLDVIVDYEFLGRLGM